MLRLGADREDACSGHYQPCFSFFAFKCFFYIFQCPSTLKEELTYNPFLRTNEEVILKAAGMITGGEGAEFVAPGDDIRARALKEIRERKDNFKYIM